MSESFILVLITFLFAVITESFFSILNRYSAISRLQINRSFSVASIKNTSFLKIKDFEVNLMIAVDTLMNC